MEKLEVMVQDLMWEKKGDGVGDKKKEKNAVFLCDPFRQSFFFLVLKSQT